MKNQINDNRYPAKEPPITIKALFTFLYLNTIRILKTAIKIVRQSVMVSFPITKQMAAIIATDATFTASRNTENSLEFRIFFTIGFNNATNTKDGKKIPRVDTTAPQNPLI